MANTDNPFGFLPVFRLDGGNLGLTRMYVKAAADTRLGIGDLVNITGAKNTVTRAAAAGPFLGPTLAFGAAADASVQPVLPANKMVVLVCQESGTIGTAAEGLNANITVADCSTVTGRSQMELDSDTEDTTNTLDLHIYQVAPYADNDGTLANARWFVQINDSTMADLKAGV